MVNWSEGSSPWRKIRADYARYCKWERGESCGKSAGERRSGGGAVRYQKRHSRVWMPGAQSDGNGIRRNVARMNRVGWMTNRVWIMRPHP